MNQRKLFSSMVVLALMMTFMMTGTPMLVPSGVTAQEQPAPGGRCSRLARGLTSPFRFLWRRKGSLSMQPSLW